jgi:hypothetical protein
VFVVGSEGSEGSKVQGFKVQGFMVQEVHGSGGSWFRRFKRFRIVHVVQGGSLKPC